MVQFFEENMTVARVFKFCICIYAMHNLVMVHKVVNENAPISGNLPDHGIKEI